MYAPADDGSAQAVHGRLDFWQFWHVGMIRYNHSMRYYLAVLFLLAILGIPWMAVNYPIQTDALVTAIEQAGSQLAGAQVAADYVKWADVEAVRRKLEMMFAPTVYVAQINGRGLSYGPALDHYLIDYKPAAKKKEESKVLDILLKR